MISIANRVVDSFDELRRLYKPNRKGRMAAESGILVNPDSLSDFSFAYAAGSRAQSAPVGTKLRINNGCTSIVYLRRDLLQCAPGSKRNELNSPADMLITELRLVANQRPPESPPKEG